VKNSSNILVRFGAICAFGMGLGAVPVLANHNSMHTTLCNQANTVGGGTLGLSPGPVGPSSLGWDVGSGQCNGSFSTVSDLLFPGGALELGLRIEERRVGQVTRNAVNDYTVQLGHDNKLPIALNRAWWNFHGSVGYGSSIGNLDALTLKIVTDVGPNQPSAPIFDLLATRGIIDARNNQANPTATFADLYQFSQNPEFGWFAPASDTDANPNGRFDYSVPGAWRLTLTAVEGSVSTGVSICVHTPGQACAPFDTDGDGVNDSADACSGTLAGSIVNASGCSIAQICPCAPQNVHGSYVSCIAKTSQEFSKQGLISKDVRQGIMKEAAQSNCGK